MRNAITNIMNRDIGFIKWMFSARSSVAEKVIKWEAGLWHFLTLFCRCNTSYLWVLLYLIFELFSFSMFAETSFPDLVHLSVLPNTARVPSLPHQVSCLAEAFEGKIFRRRNMQDKGFSRKLSEFSSHQQ